MFRKFKSLSRTTKIAVVSVLGLAVLGTAGASNQPSHTANITSTDTKAVLGSQTQTPAMPAAKAPVITTQIVTETQPIAFTNTTVSTASLPKGTTKITAAGVNGISTLTYRVTFTDGQQTAKDLVSQITTTQPVTQVTSVGTYVAPPVQSVQPVCPNGTYINTAGNTVCSPYASPTTPEGATAQCVDGTYSYSQSHSGTCSHHGGVSNWL